MQCIFERAERLWKVVRGGADTKEQAEFCYICTKSYQPEDEDGIAWNYPNIAIGWLQLHKPSLRIIAGDEYCLDDGTVLVC